MKGSAQDAGAWIMTLDTVGALILQTAASSHIQVCYDEHGYFPTVAGYLTFMY